MINKFDVGEYKSIDKQKIQFYSLWTIRSYFFYNHKSTKSDKYLTNLNILKYLAPLRIVFQIGNSKYKFIRWVNRDISNMHNT